MERRFAVVIVADAGTESTTDWSKAKTSPKTKRYDVISSITMVMVKTQLSSKATETPTKVSKYSSLNAIYGMCVCAVDW